MADATVASNGKERRATPASFSSARQRFEERNIERIARIDFVIDGLLEERAELVAQNRMVSGAPGRCA